MKRYAMKQRTILIILIALLLSLCISACGATDSPPAENILQPSNIIPPETPTPPETLEPSETPNVSLAETPETPDSGSETADHEKIEEADTVMKMNVQIGEKIFTATLEDNAAVREFVEMMREAPVSIDMRDYSGFEKVGSLELGAGRSLTTDNRQITTDAGDIVLYNGNQIVMFYGSNSWSYTKIGRIDDLTGWEDALGSGGITAVFSLAE